ncbi:dynein axonemal assembly factor 6 [Anopheles maculipalpis]|uniref:dynein axonemal assembly factor 6 n=1 Tax=Anopheles maculipalpis TaxID=1496333 RepID=UPI0021599EEA|nr:dynein axonemal assembly factor 6 [Anopheles maculipalpis]
MSLLGSENIKLLQKLFKANADDSSSDENEPAEDTVPQLGPGDIGEPAAIKPKRKPTTDPAEHVKPCSYAPLKPHAHPEAEQQPNTLEEWEAQQLQQDRALFDSRKQPEYRISYRQTVATEDIYLQMNCKTPATASCENMILEVFLTGEDDSVGIHQIELEVKNQRVTVGSPKYRLDLCLPHRINPDKGNAAWLSDQKTLRLTLTMVRELDFVNF